LFIAVVCCVSIGTAFGQENAQRQQHQHQHQSQHQRRKQAEEKPQGPPPVTPPVRDPDHTFQLRVRDWLELKRRNIVMQRRDYSCGAAALATVGRYHWGDNVDEDLFLRALDSILTDEEILDRIENGLAMSDLRRAAVDVGYQAVVGKITYEQLLEVKVPVIVGISPEGHDHFVVFRGTDGMWVYVADPIRGNVRMPILDFTRQWQENAVLAIHKKGAKVRTDSPLNVSWEEKQLGKTTDHVIRTQAQRQPAMRKPRLSR
jgi:predicted double-glycine peptidase